jgi:Mn2+/Fe2+ NRAMP family transporter
MGALTNTRLTTMTAVAVTILIVSLNVYLLIATFS